MVLPDCSGLWDCVCRYDLDSFQSGLVVSSSLFGALAGSSAAFVVGDKLGRRRELLLAAVLYGELWPLGFPRASQQASQTTGPLALLDHPNATSESGLLKRTSYEQNKDASSQLLITVHS